MNFSATLLANNAGIWEVWHHDEIVCTGFDNKVEAAIWANEHGFILTN